MLEDLQRTTPVINGDARYWFVRTDSGNLYQPFIASNSIAIGYKEISLEFVRSLNATGLEKEKLKEEIKRHYPPKRNEEGKVSDLSGLAASQILRFCNEMKRGDVVIIPSERTERLGIGKVADDGPFEEILSYDGQAFPDFKKRRKVEWVRGVDRSTMNPNLFKLLLNQQTIVDATPYAEWIDASLYQFFRKGDTFHYVLHVGAEEHIPAQSLFRAFLGLFDLAKDFAATEGVELDVDGVETRINLNSPGDVEFWMGGVAAIGLIAVLVVFINGGGFEFSLKSHGAKVSLKTEGLLKRLSDYLDSRQNRRSVEEVRKKLEKLNVKTPDQVIELLKNVRK